MTLRPPLEASWRRGVGGVLLRPTRRAVLLATLALAGCAAWRRVLPAPPMIAVADWGGQAVPASGAPPQRLHALTLHHSGEVWPPPSRPQAEVAQHLRWLQQWSQLTRRWRDIPYHFVIAPDGRIYATRPLAEVGDTHTEYDPRGHALVMLLGNFEEQTPTEPALQSLVELSAWLVEQHGLPDTALATHRDHSRQTVCPGAQLGALVPWWREAVARRRRGEPLPPRP